MLSFHECLQSLKKAQEIEILESSYAIFLLEVFMIFEISK